MNRFDVVSAMCNATDLPGVCNLLMASCRAAKERHSAGDVDKREQHFECACLILKWLADKAKSDSSYIDVAVDFAEPTIYNEIVKLTEDDTETYRHMRPLIAIMSDLGMHVRNQLGQRAAE